MGWLRLWWRQSGHYDRLSSHLLTRKMGRLTGATIAVIATGLALVAVATIFTPQRTAKCRPACRHAHRGRGRRERFAVVGAALADP